MFRITIIIPCYKRPKLVVDALKSCIAQTYAPYEIIIGDDSPDDLTKVEIEKVKKKSPINIKYFHNKPSLKQEENVNMLFSEVSGDKVLLLHDDDLLLEKALEILVNCFKMNSDISVAYGKQYIIGAEGNNLSFKKSENHNNNYFRSAQYVGKTLKPIEAALLQQFPNNCYLINADLAKRIKYRKIGVICDFDFGLRVGQSGAKFYFVNEYIAKYRVWEGNISNTNNESDNNLIAYEMVENLNLSYSSRKYQKFFLERKSLLAFRQAIKINQFEKALNLYFRHFSIIKLFTLGGMKQFAILTLSFPKIVKYKYRKMISKKII